MKNSLHRLLSFLLAIVLVLGMVGFALPAVRAADSSAIDASALAGKKVSILADSISTYAGISNNTSINSTIDISADKLN